MRRLLGLSLAIMVGLTALAAAPVAASSRDHDCTVVMTSEGRKCLSDRDLRLFDQRLLDQRLFGQRFLDRRGDLTDREMRSMVECGCLSTREQQYLDRILEGSGRMLVRRVLRFMAARDCFSDTDLLRLRRAAASLDRDDLKAMVKEGGPCQRVLDRRMGRFGWLDFLRWWGREDYGCMSDSDLRRIDRRTGDLDIRDIRTILRYDGRGDCVTPEDVRRLDRRTDDLDLLDILDLFGGFDLR